MKKGFTLIELLAVIIILALLMIVAVPNVLNTLNDSKNKAFIAQAQSIWKTAETQFVKDSMTHGTSRTCYDKTTLDMQSVANSVSFVVRLSSIGKVQSIEVIDSASQLKATGSSGINNISLTPSASYSAIVCSGGGGGGAAPSGYVTDISSADSTGANPPELGNLVPIVYDGSQWIKATTSEPWYNYGERKWANAVVLASGVSKNIGDPISENEIDLWYVWIPRYEFNIPSESVGSTGNPKAVGIHFVSSSATTNLVGYSHHPGFSFNYNNVSGIWVSKFEATKGHGEVVQTKANTESWTGIDIYTIDQKVRLGMKASYTAQLAGFDSHVSRYLEWTSISYLTTSIYGRCSSSSSCTEVSVTPKVSSKIKTGGGNYKSNPTYSSTGNVYGVYDLNEGADEYVMGFLKDTPTNTNPTYASGFTTSNLPASKYYDTFESSNNTVTNFSALTKVNGSTTKVGTLNDILNPLTSREGWFDDYNNFVNSTNPWFSMGYYSGYNTGGVFAQAANAGNANPLIGFRPVLVKE